MAARVSPRIGFLHTVPTLVEPFERDLRAAVPHAEASHRVDPGLLARAREIGVDATVDARVAELVAQLADEGVDAVLVTCSSIGESAERAAASSSVPVVRVDAAMAAEAVALARRDDGRSGRVVVLATVEATLGPTVRLLRRAASHEVAAPTVETRLLAEALRARENGAQPLHDALIGQALREEVERADAVVLAQASMAQAAAGLLTQVPVLSSPSFGLRDVLEAAGRATVRRVGPGDRPVTNTST